MKKPFCFCNNKKGNSCFSLDLVQFFAEVIVIDLKIKNKWLKNNLNYLIVVLRKQSLLEISFYKNSEDAESKGWTEKL